MTKGELTITIVTVGLYVGLLFMLPKAIDKEIQFQDNVLNSHLTLEQRTEITKRSV
jgi:hypothetical protein